MHNSGLSINYDIIVSELSDENGGVFFAYYKDNKGIMGDGKTKDEAIADVKSAFEIYVEVSLQNKDTIPEPLELG
ncbi:MAG: type II toxin-antitoxin system HicB family antitoxin [Campylobacterota bacterium]|nr:type II toxin-antitoxin system HicB family antitoxin [Campylobacterota bacterium]